MPARTGPRISGVCRKTKNRPLLLRYTAAAPPAASVATFTPTATGSTDAFREAAEGVPPGAPCGGRRCGGCCGRVGGCCGRGSPPFYEDEGGFGGRGVLAAGREDMIMSSLLVGGEKWGGEHFRRVRVSSSSLWSSSGTPKRRGGSEVLWTPRRSQRAAALRDFCPVHEVLWTTSRRR